MRGFEWPGPHGHKCRAIAESVDTGEQIQCMLRHNHSDLQHRWESPTVNGFYKSVMWVATGPVTPVGGFGLRMPRKKEIVNTIPRADPRLIRVVKIIS